MSQQENSLKGSFAQARKKAGILHSKIVNAVMPDAESSPVTALDGIWCFDALEVPAIGIRREEKGKDYFFEFSAKGNVVAHVNGTVFRTSYVIREGCVLFGQAELAAMKLEIDQDKLKMKNYLGATLVFSKGADGVDKQR